MTAVRIPSSEHWAGEAPTVAALDSDDSATYQMRGSSSLPGRLDASATSP